MPNGYTAKLYEGEQSFNDFVLGCARAFGAFIEMRDDAQDAPLRMPRAYEYHAEQEDAAKARLIVLNGLTDEECTQRARDEYHDAVVRDEESREKNRAMRRRYEDMRAQVEAWTPPTADHISMKEKMIDWLNQSIRFDTDHDWWPKPEAITGIEWRNIQVKQAKRDVEYHRAAYAEEIERTNGRRQWIVDLFDSLGLEAPA